MSGMEKAVMKRIMYGVTDFALMRNPKKPAYFVDHTELIRELEDTARYTLFLRPRRFGKSLLCAILQTYYDVDYAHKFEEFFGELKIGRNPTEEHNKYLVLVFDFAEVDKEYAKTQDSFNFVCSCRINAFADNYRRTLGEERWTAIKAESDCHKKLIALASGLNKTGIKLYIIIDEYDNFANTILAQSRANYEALCHGDGFFKQFFTVLKSATTGTDAPITRMFITGVTPLTMDDVTSGFNIGANISMNPAFAPLTGFTQSDLREMLGYYRENAGFDFDVGKVYATLNDWYDHYRFSPEAELNGAPVPSVANPTLVWYFMMYFLQNHKAPPQLIDSNLKMDYLKIRHVITESRKMNGNYHRLEEILEKKTATAVLQPSFQARELNIPDNFVSFLYYNGLITVTGERMGRSLLAIPNATIAEFMHLFVPKAYQDVNGIEPHIFDLSGAMADFAENGDWRQPLGIACDVVTQYLKVRDLVEGERVVQTAMCALMRSAHGPYLVDHEIEAGGGFADIVWAPDLGRYPEIAYAAIIELKYLKEDEKSSPVALAKLKAEARKQLDRYAADHDLEHQWCLTNEKGKKGNGKSQPGSILPSVTLKRLVVIFKGTELVLCEELVKEEGRRKK